MKLRETIEMLILSVMGFIAAYYMLQVFAENVRLPV